MPEVSDTTAQIAETLTNVLNTHVANRYSMVAMTTGKVLGGFGGRGGGRTFFDMEALPHLGIFAAIIASVAVSAYYEKVEDGYWINVSLSYSHPGGGRNGSEIATVWLDDAFELASIRWPNGDLFRAKEAQAA